MNAIKQWFESKGGYAHVLAATFTALMLAYAAVPSFHGLVNQVHAALPGWLQELATTAVALYVWYKSTQTPAAQVAAAKAIMDAPDAPSAAQISAVTPAKISILLVALLLPALMLSGCTTWERATFQSLASAKATIDGAHAAYEVSATLPNGSCATVTAGTACIPHTAAANAAITKAVQADTLTVQLMEQYEEDKAAGQSSTALTAASVAVDNALTSLTTITAEVQALYGK